MLGVGAHIATGGAAQRRLDTPPGFAWDNARFPLQIKQRGRRASSGLDPRSLVDPAIWTGAAIHVDSASGDDGNTGLGSADGDFLNAKRTIHAAFLAGNATQVPYRVIVKPGMYEESAFTKNGQREPDQAVAILGWNGPVVYRTGPASVAWTLQTGTYSAPVSAVKRVFRTDQTGEGGLYAELLEVADPATCAATLNSWCDDAGTVHVNIGQAFGAQDIALIRSFHGARFMSHAQDLYLENIHTEGGITGGLHCDAIAARNIVGVKCSFRYAAPSNPAAPLDAVRIRRTNGLAAFFECDASRGAKDGWSFHEDGTSGLHVLLQDCEGHENGALSATSCNGFTTHDTVRAIVLGGRFGHSQNGTEVHCIQATHTWMVGTQAVARDPDGSSVAFKCSNQSQMWLQDTRADAVGATAFALEANGGTILTRGHHAVAGTTSVSNGGVIGTF